MIYRHAIAEHSYVFDSLRDLLAKATPPRSGDRLAGLAAGTAEEMIAARMALADVPLKQFLEETVVPYEDDDVTRLIIDSHDAPAFAAISSLTVGAFRDWLLLDAATSMSAFLPIWPPLVICKSKLLAVEIFVAPIVILASPSIRSRLVRVKREYSVAELFV